MKLNDSLRQSIINAGGTPRARSLRGLLQQLVPLYGGSTFPDNDNVNGLLRAAIIGSGGTPTARKFRGLLAQLVQARGGTVTGNEKPSELGVKLAATNGGFAPVTGAALSTPVESNTITLSNLVGTPAITVTGGQYSKNGAAYTGSAGTVASGDTVKVRLTSSASYSTMVQATLTIGGVPRVFSVTTMGDPTPTPTPTPTPGIPAVTQMQRVDITYATNSSSPSTALQIQNAKARLATPTQQILTASQPVTNLIRIGPVAAPGAILVFAVQGTGNGALADPVITESFDANPSDGSGGTYNPITFVPIKPSTDSWEHRWQAVALSANASPRFIRLILSDAGTRTITVHGPIPYQLPAPGSNPSAILQIGASHEAGRGPQMKREMDAEIPGSDWIPFNLAVDGSNLDAIAGQLTDGLALLPWVQMISPASTGNSATFPYPDATQSTKDNYASKLTSIINSIKAAGKVALPERMTYRQSPYNGITTSGTANQEQGALPWNTAVIDPAEALTSPEFMDPNTGYSICDNYIAMLVWRAGIGGDGNHGDMRRSLLARINSYGRKALGLPVVTQLESLVSDVERYKTQWYVDKANEALTAIPSGSYKTALAARITAKTGPAAITVNVGTAVDTATAGVRTQNWNNASNTLTIADLIDATGAATGISLATNGNWSTLTDTSTSNVPEIYDFPVGVLASRVTATVAKTVTFSGLSRPTYRLKLAGFRNPNIYADLTLVTINGITRVMRAGEWDSKVMFEGVAPTGGQIVITFTGGGDAGAGNRYLNVIELLPES